MEGVEDGHHIRPTLRSLLRHSPSAGIVILQAVYKTILSGHLHFLTIFIQIKNPQSILHSRTHTHIHTHNSKTQWPPSPPPTPQTTPTPPSPTPRLAPPPPTSAPDSSTKTATSAKIPSPRFGSESDSRRVSPEVICPTTLVCPLFLGIYDVRVKSVADIRQRIKDQLPIVWHAKSSDRPRRSSRTMLKQN